MLGLAASCAFPGEGIWNFAEIFLVSMVASHILGVLES
jgi:hypothetical protein